jgi:hypothetical protein
MYLISEQFTTIGKFRPGYHQSDYTNQGWIKIVSRKAAKLAKVSIYFFDSWREKFIILPK